MNYFDWILCGAFYLGLVWVVLFIFRNKSAVCPGCMGWGEIPGTSYLGQEVKCCRCDGEGMVDPSEIADVVPVDGDGWYTVTLTPFDSVKPKVEELLLEFRNGSWRYEVWGGDYFVSEAARP